MEGRIGTAGAIAMGIAHVVLITQLVIIGVLFFIGWRMRTTEHPHDKLETN